MSSIISKAPLGFHWKTQDPFLFCAHHLDYYPKGNENLGPDMPLSRRSLGQDFDLSNDWKMYHGMTVPGFPEHPHRGFETVTIVLEGFVDHSDSAGQAGRYGQGDVQWMTAGSGMQHSEMFPLLNKKEDNTLHLFQVWLNLPKKNKFVKPHFKMLWAEDIPIIEFGEDSKNTSTLRLIAGEFKGRKAVEPNPDSWAADESHGVDIFVVDLEKGDRIEIPAKSSTQQRAIYFYDGEALDIDGERLEGNHQAYLSQRATVFSNEGSKARFLILQAEPMNEPVVQYGPFVMNTKEEIQEAYDDYQKTQFGGWPWKRSDPVHGTEAIRFARYEDGREERR